MTLDKSLLRQAAERVRDAAPGTTPEALRHLQACFGWETVLELLDEADRVYTEKSGAEMLELLRHAVGKRGHRNYFAAEPHGPDWESWELLVGLGLANHGRGDSSSGLVYFHVSNPGIAMLKKLSPRKYKRELGADLKPRGREASR
ncbi:MAG TPA: hypothetical protein VER11_34670 [Polyangiaceae bacterium]|nr:hypothetical protein [Polyangiaceae bacterium]